MVEPTKEVLKEEIKISFFIQFVEVKGYHTTYHKLYAKINSSESEIDYQRVSPEEYTVHNILKNIDKLYQVYTYAQSEKLQEGVREEILKLVSLIIWNISH
ncbi:hypothetical protein [Sulfolobus spindle-shaped virus]|nr:hypothetical protein [Sulfolobus spindle-shaped virus]AZG03776.1 hypothetical protein [Sulfolobus spindle-shaped virus]